MADSREHFHLGIWLWFYALLPITLGPVVFVLAINVLGFSWLIAMGGVAVGIVIGEIAAGQGLFTDVELAEDSVTLTSPFRRLTISRSDVAAINLWWKSRDEEKKPFWKQAAVLNILLRNGRRVGLGMLGATLLRRIAFRVSPPGMLVESIGFPWEHWR